MSNFTDYAENKLADRIRGQAWTLGASLYIGLASAASDSAVTELAGTGYARVAVTRSLANWAGTQGPGTTLASSGTTHASSNNAAINFGTSGAAWGTANYVVIFDASTSGNAIAYIPIATPIVIGSGQPVSLAIASVAFTLGLSGGCSDYLANKLIDDLFRAQAFTFPATLYAGLFTAPPSNAGGGTEVGGGIGYARVSIAGSLAAWSGTQSAGSTTASSGTGGQISNNAAVTFPAPSGSWGAVSHVGLFDASSAGNLIFWGALSQTKSVPAGAAAPSFAPAGLTLTIA